MIPFNNPRYTFPLDKVRGKKGRKFEFDTTLNNSKSSSSIETTLSEAASSKKLDRDSNPGPSESEVKPLPQRPPGSVAKTARPTSARNLTSMLKKEAKISEASNPSGKREKGYGIFDFIYLQ